MCAEITMCDGGELLWVDDIRYFGVFFIRGAKFKCSIHQAKRSFYRAANHIFAKIGRLVSEEVMVQLSKQQFFMKLFKTSNMEIVNYCQRLFGCDLPSTLLKQRFEKFITTL